MERDWARKVLLRAEDSLDGSVEGVVVDIAAQDKNGHEGMANEQQQQK